MQSIQGTNGNDQKAHTKKKDHEHLKNIIDHKNFIKSEIQCRKQRDQQDTAMLLILLNVNKKSKHVKKINTSSVCLAHGNYTGKARDKSGKYCTIYMQILFYAYL